MEKTKRKRRPTYYFVGRPEDNYYDSWMSSGQNHDCSELLQKTRDFADMCAQYSCKDESEMGDKGTQYYHLCKYFSKSDPDSYAYWSMYEFSLLEEFEIEDCPFRIDKETGNIIIEAPEVRVVLYYTDYWTFNGVIYLKDRNGEEFGFEELAFEDAKTISFRNDFMTPAIFMTKAEIRKNKKEVERIEKAIDKIYEKYEDE